MFHLFFLFFAILSNLNNIKKKTSITTIAVYLTDLHLMTHTSPLRPLLWDHTAPSRPLLSGHTSPMTPPGAARPLKANFVVPADLVGPIFAHKPSRWRVAVKGGMGERCLDLDLR